MQLITLLYALKVQLLLTMYIKVSPQNHLFLSKLSTSWASLCHKDSFNTKGPKDYKKHSTRKLDLYHLYYVTAFLGIFGCIRLHMMQKKADGNSTKWME